MSEPRLLSTKKLTLAQKELLLNAGFGLVEYDAIRIEHLNFDVPEEIENAIFTSQNGVRSYFSNKTKNREISSCYCVGEKTKALLEENGQKVVKMAQNSEELGQFILKTARNESFFYFCGSQRRDDLPDLLKSAKIELFEVKTYKTELKSRHFGQKFDGILFFSPSGVQSFTMENSLTEETAFCIGKTTAEEAKKHTNKVVIANSPSVESVIAKAAKTFQIQRS